MVQLLKFPNYNVIGDIAGNFLTLKALLAKMPQDAELISLGDPNDRGPRSKEVIEFLMSNGRTVQSNHAHLFTHAWRQSATPGAQPRFYEKDVFMWNGGGPTLNSYGENWHIDTIWRHVPEDHIKWLESCPMYIETDGFVMSHAPLHIQRTLQEASDIGTGFDELPSFFQSEYSLIWNRGVPERPHPDLKGKINLFGHNSSNMVKVYTTQFPNGLKVDNNGLQKLLKTQDQYPIYGICIDTSSDKKLTGLHLPTMTIYEQEYIDDNE